MYTTQNLSHNEAMAMIDVIRRRLEAEKKAAAIAVADSHGELLAFIRMDGCHLPPGQIAQNKAFTAARERNPSGAIGESSHTRPFPMTNYGDLRYVGWAGGLPIVVNGQVVGAIGISGLDEAAEVELGAYAISQVVNK